jgi:hypothetical protein
MIWARLFKSSTRSKQRQFQTSLFDYDGTWEQIMALYYDEYLPLLMRHLELISPAELERRSANSQKTG